MSVRKISSVVALAGLLKSIFVGGRFQKELPMDLTDNEGNKICRICKDDPQRWVPTPYSQSYAATRKLCTKKEWETMSTVEQINLCDCWEALAVMEYLDAAYDDGARFNIEEYEC